MSPSARTSLVPLCPCQLLVHSKQLRVHGSFATNLPQLASQLTIGRIGSIYGGISDALFCTEWDVIVYLADCVQHCAQQSD